MQILLSDESWISSYLLTRKSILGYQIHTARMTLSDDVNLEEFVMTKDEFSGADIKAICTEAGLLALRERRMKVRPQNGKLSIF